MRVRPLTVILTVQVVVLVVRCEECAPTMWPRHLRWMRRVTGSVRIVRIRESGWHLREESGKLQLLSVIASDTASGSIL
jgi:hypothetical protein